jgi:hypothetical protein
MHAKGDHVAGAFEAWGAVTQSRWVGRSTPTKPNTHLSAAHLDVLAVLQWTSILANVLRFELRRALLAFVTFFLLRSGRLAGGFGPASGRSCLSILGLHARGQHLKQAGYDRRQTLEVGNKLKGERRVSATRSAMRQESSTRSHQRPNAPETFRIGGSFRSLNFTKHLE